MPTLPSFLLAFSAFIIGALGVMHLLITFRGNKIHPRNADLFTALQSELLVITRQTTMWKAWIGFNASHSYGALLFALVYGYLALAQSDLLFSSLYLQAVGLVMLLGYCHLGFRYWFSVPFRGIVCATFFYVVALAINAMGY
jgi:hypothetical protein